MQNVQKDRIKTAQACDGSSALKVISGIAKILLVGVVRGRGTGGGAGIALSIVGIGLSLGRGSAIVH